MMIVSMVIFRMFGWVGLRAGVLFLVAAGEGVANLVDGVLCGAFGVVDAPLVLEVSVSGSARRLLPSRDLLPYRCSCWSWMSFGWRKTGSVRV